MDRCRQHTFFNDKHRPARKITRKFLSNQIPPSTFFPEHFKFIIIINIHYYNKLLIYIIIIIINIHYYNKFVSCSLKMELIVIIININL